MPVFTIQTPQGKKLRIEAADEASALRGAEQWSRENKPKRSGFDEVAGFMANVNRGAAIGDELAAVGRTAVNALSGRVRPTQWKGGTALSAMSALGDDVMASMGVQRRTEDEFAADRPKAAALGRGTGNALTAAIPAPKLLQGAEVAGRGVNALRGASMAALTGSAYAAADRGTGRERLRAATDPAMLAASAALGAGGGALAPAKPRAAPAPVDANVALLASEGVQMTPGQIRGGMAKTVEDAATSLPILGPAIQDARSAGLESFNKAALSRALAPLGEKLPDDMPAGNEGIRYVGDLLSKGYDDAIPGVTIQGDAAFADDVRSALANMDTLTEDNQGRLAKIIQQRVQGRLTGDGSLDGQAYKKLQSELDFEVSRFTGSNDPDARAIGEALTGVQSALENAARRQDPAFAAKIDALDQGWAEIARIETAGGKAGAEQGVFTPSMYDAAVRSAEGRVRKRGIARGEAMGYDLAQAGRAVLPSKVPDSGTATRGMIGAAVSLPGAVLGGTFGGGVGAAAGVAGTAAGLGAASRAYSPQAIEAANRALNAQIGRQAQAEALAELRQLAASSPEAQELYREIVGRLSQGAGVTGASAASPPAIP